MANFQVGDIDGDGQVNQSDLALLKSLLADSGLVDKLSDEDKARLDINGDGRVSYEDVMQLCQRMIAQEGDAGRQLADKFAALRSRARS